MPSRSKVVVGNWKMNGGLVSNATLLEAIAKGAESGAGDLCGVALCVPYPYLAQAAAALEASAVALGSQDVSEYVQGAYTGEVSASMLLEFGCRHAIVGHSERRTWFGDTNERVAQKADRAIDAGLTPIVCVGETLQERDQGRAEQIVSTQLDAVLQRIGAQKLASVILAYEPVWAIGTGRTATPEEAQAMHAMIREHVGQYDAQRAATVKILYGGSVKPSNAASLFGCEDIDGGLIGGASLVADDFLGIVHAAVDAARRMADQQVAGILA
jgi:triosephosphate isomerase